MTEPSEYAVDGSDNHVNVNKSTTTDLYDVADDASWSSDTRLLDSNSSSEENVVDAVGNPMAKECHYDSSDTSSWTSDTPLLVAISGQKCQNELAQFYAPVNTAGNGNASLLATIPEDSGMEQTDLAQFYAPGFDSTSEVKNEMGTIQYTILEPGKGNGVNALDDLQFTVVDVKDLSEQPGPTDSEVAKCAPISVFGSGWEFGSICSMNLSSSNDIRSRFGSMEGRTCHNPSSAGAQKRLLSKVLMDKIGSIEFGKTFDKDLTLSFVEPVSEKYNVPEENKNMKNLLVLSLGITLLHIANFGLRNLQSSLNSENGLGVFSLGALCGAFMIGSLISRFVVEKFRPKICTIVAVLGHIVYIIANYHAKFYTILPASIVQGMGSALMWNAVCTYITEIGLDEASRKKKPSNSVLSKYFGIFFLILQSSMVLGNLISSLILSQTGSNNVLSTTRVQNVFNETGFDSILLYVADFTKSNGTNFASSPENVTDNILAAGRVIPTKPLCGAAYCILDSVAASAKPQISTMQKSIIIGSYTFCGILAIIVIQLFLDQLPNYVSHTPSMKVAVKQIASVLGMVFDRQFCFIVLLCLYTVIGNGFVVADVLKVFVTCPLGMKMVGYSMICFGIMGSISSYMFGKLAKCIGNIAAFLTAAVLNVICLSLMVKWEPTPDDQYWLFAFVGVWGFADGIWQSQINSVISSVFSDCYENAFSCCRFLQGVAGLVFFNMSNMFCLMTKIFFTMGTCVLSVTLYLVMEILNRRSAVEDMEVEVEADLDDGKPE